MNFQAILGGRKSLGIDIGSRYIKIIEVEYTETHNKVLNAIVRKINFDSQGASQDKKKAIVEALKSIFSEVRFSSSKGVTGLPGNRIFFRKISIPDTSEANIRRVVLLEAEHQMPLSRESMYVDYQVRSISETNEKEAIIFGTKKDTIAEHLKIISEANLKVNYIDIAPIALFNFFLLSELLSQEETIALVNIGAATIDIVIVRESNLDYVRTASIGGDFVTEKIAKGLDLSFEEAERLKIEYKGENDTDLFTIINSAIDHLVFEIKRTFDYYFSLPEGRPINKVILSGGFSKLANINKLFEEKLNLPVINILDCESQNILFSTLKTNYAEDLPFLPTSCGLALRAFPQIKTKVEKVLQFDFSPQEIKDWREFSAKKVPIGVAGLLLLLIVYLGSLFGSNEIERKQETIATFQSKAKLSESGYSKYTTLMEKKKLLEKQYSELAFLLGKRGYWLNIISELNKITPIDIWLTKISAREDYSILLEGKGLSEGSITDFTNKLDKSGIFKVKAGSLEMKPNIVDVKLGKPTTVFKLELECKAPKLPKKAS